MKMPAPETLSIPQPASVAVKTGTSNVPVYGAIAAARIAPAAQAMLFVALGTANTETAPCLPVQPPALLPLEAETRPTEAVGHRTTIPATRYGAIAAILTAHAAQITYTVDQDGESCIFSFL